MIPKTIMLSLAICIVLPQGVSAELSAGTREGCEQQITQTLTSCREMLKKKGQDGAGREKQQAAMQAVMAPLFCGHPSVEARLSPEERGQTANFKRAVRDVQEQFGIWTVREGEAFAKRFLSELNRACGPGGPATAADAAHALPGLELRGDYYPLQAGDVREFSHTYRQKDERLPDRSEQKIAQQLVDPQSGHVELRNEKGKPLAWKTREGIVAARGTLLLKLPARVGEEWLSGDETYDERLFRIEEGGLSVTVNNKQYRDCIKVSTASRFHALARQERGGYYSFESYTTYCPGAGPVITEGYEISREGGRTWTSRTELLSFKRGQQVAAAPSGGGAFIEQGSAFRFPKKGYLHPQLSPNEAWVVYRMNSDFGNLYYSAIGGQEDRVVPLDDAGRSAKEKRIGGASWSPDGSLLAVSVEDDPGSRIALVEFSRTGPVVIGSVRSNGSAPAWTGDAVLVYLDEFGNVMRKERTAKPETVVSLRKSHAGVGGAEKVFADRQGTILFQAEAQGVPLFQTRPLRGSRMSRVGPVAGAKPEPLSADAGIVSADMSPDGNHVLLKYTDRSIIMNHKTGETVGVLTPRVEHTAWSPDGSRLAYVGPGRASASDRNPSFKIFDLHTRTTKDHGITVERYFSWTPDGDHIIYSAKFKHETLMVLENGVYVMRADDGKELARLTRISANGVPSISASGRLVLWPALNMDTFFLASNPLDPALFRKAPGLRTGQKLN